MLVSVVGVDDLNATQMPFLFSSLLPCGLTIFNASVREINALVIFHPTLVAQNAPMSVHWLLDAHTLEANAIFRALTQLSSRSSDGKNTRCGPSPVNQFFVCLDFLKRSQHRSDAFFVKDLKFW